MFGKKRIVYVLSSGAAYGYAHIGALKAFEECGLRPSAIVGTSIGSIMGAVYATGATSKDLESIVTQLDMVKLTRIFFPAFPHGGLINPDGIREFLKGILGTKRFEDLCIPFVCVAADIETGREVILDKGPLLDAVLASISMPVIFPPHQYKGMNLCDGGVVNPLPIDIGRQFGGSVIAVNVTPRIQQQVKTAGKAHYTSLLTAPREESSSLSLSKIATSIEKAIAKTKPPAAAKASSLFARANRTDLNILHMLSNAIDIFSQPLIQKKPSWGRNYTLIEPDLSHYHMFSFNEKHAMIESGYQAALSQKKKLCRLAKR